MLLAYHGDPALKQTYLDRAEAHRLADEIVQGTGWDGSRGCSVGCLMHGYDDAHEQFPAVLGIPESLAQLLDAIHEGIGDDSYKMLPGRFVAAIQPGADLSLVEAKFLHWLLTSDEIGLLGIAKDAGKVAISDVAALWLRIAEGGTVASEEWSAAESAARSAAESAARSAAWSAAWSKMASKLLSLLSDAPIPT